MPTRPSLAVALFFIGCAPAPAPVAVPVPVAAVPAEPPLEPVLDILAAPTEEEMSIRRDSSDASEMIAVARAGLADPSARSFTKREAEAFARALDAIAAYDYERAFGWFTALDALRRPLPPVVRAVEQPLGRAIGFPTRRWVVAPSADADRTPKPRVNISLRVVDELARARFDTEWLDDHGLTWPGETAGTPPHNFQSWIRGLDFGDEHLTLGYESVALTRRGSRVTTELDFHRLNLGPLARSSWAFSHDGTVYVSFANDRDLAAPERGPLVAVALGRPARLLWRTRARTCTAQAFAVLPDVVICGGEDERGRPLAIAVERNSGAIAAEARLADPSRAVLSANGRVFSRGERSDVEIIVTR